MSEWKKYEIGIIKPTREELIILEKEINNLLIVLMKQGVSVTLTSESGVM